MKKSEIKNGVWFFRSFGDFGTEEVPWFIQEKAYNYLVFRAGNGDCYNVPKESLEIETDNEGNVTQIVMRMPRRNYLGFWKDASNKDNIKTVLRDVGINEKELSEKLSDKMLETMEVDFKENCEWVQYKLNKIDGGGVARTAEFEAGVVFAIAMIRDVVLEPGAVVIDATANERWVVE